MWGDKNWHSEGGYRRIAGKNALCDEFFCRPLRLQSVCPQTEKNEMIGQAPG